MAVRQGNSGAGVDAALAVRLVEELGERATAIRGLAVFDAAGRQLAASDDARWEDSVAALWAAAEGEDEPAAAQIHVGTEEGEVFSVREGHATVVATSERFALASLMFCDLRALLRDLDPAAGS